MAQPNATPEKMLLDRSEASVTIDLYRAALGPVGTDYYLRAFTRFDAAGHSGPSWNWGAALLTINWLAFRQLWTAALAYVGALVFAVLVLFGIGRLVIQVPPSGQWGLLGLLLTAAVAVPGALGNAWLYAAINKRMEHAMASSATLEDAQVLLRKNAAGRRRLGFVATANATLCAIVGLIIPHLPDSATLPLTSAKMSQARTATVEEWQAAPSASASASAHASVAASVLAVPASSSGTRMSQGLVQVANSAAPPLLALPASASGLPTSASSAPAIARVLPAAGSGSASAPTAGSATGNASAPAVAMPKPVKRKESTKAAELAKHEPRQKEAAPHLKPQREAKTTAASAPASSPISDTYQVNVGLFADENNARNAYTKLKDAGLPAQSQEIKTSKGPRTRVRVGPFETQAEAERAADTIRSLRLEALVFKP